MRGADPERIEQRDVLVRLRAESIVRSHDEQCSIDLAGTDEHVADQLVVPRHVDEVDRRAVVEIEMGIPDIDRHAAPTLLGEAVRIDPGERAEQRRLAVIDVAGRAHDDGHRPASAILTVAANRRS